MSPDGRLTVRETVQVGEVAEPWIYSMQDAGIK
jgi:hypothetical protein